MANLPDARLQVSQPLFFHTGCDCFGPFLVKQGRSLVKRWGCILTCMTVRAVHLEVLHSLSTDSFTVFLHSADLSVDAVRLDTCILITGRISWEQIKC